jgi:hypothetical protein
LNQTTCILFQTELRFFVPSARPRGVPFRQASLQYFTSAQQRSHFLRHRKGLPQWTQIFSGSGRREDMASP